MRTQHIQIGNHQWDLPVVLPYRGVHYFYQVEGFRAPQEGELYVSVVAPGGITTDDGSKAHPQIFKALVDLPLSCLVVSLTREYGRLRTDSG